MPKSIKREGEPFRLKFGGGINSRASAEDIDPKECASGENFILDLSDQQFKNRPPFDLIGQLPNGSEVRGFITLLKTDNTVSTLVQGGDTVYEWDGASGFTFVATVSATAKLRGRIEQNWQLSDKVIITDINLVDPVKEWDGTTFQDITFTDEDSNAFGTFKAKYCYVDKERAIFANVVSASTTPNLIVGSALGSYTQITVANRPSSAISEADPFFIPHPDNMSINGLVQSFNQTVISSQRGSLYKLVGSSAKDFQIDLVMPKSGVSGDEAISALGGDIYFGRMGRIESVFDTARSGDTETNDVSKWIGDQTLDETNWLIAVNNRLQRAYFHPVGKSKIWTFFKPIFDLGRLRETIGAKQSALSPWCKWTTAHASSFNPTAMMNVYDPSDTLEYVLWGDANGNVYRMEGTGSGDAGSAEITSFRLSALLASPVGAKIYDQEGYVRYRRKVNESTLNITFKFQGEHVFNSVLNLTLPGQSIDSVYGATAYYGTTEFYGINENDFIRQRFAVPGASNEYQIRTEVSGKNDFTINEVGLRYEEAS